MNNERPRLTHEGPIPEGIRHALGQQAIVRSENRPYAQDQLATVVLPREQVTVAFENTEAGVGATTEQYAEFDQTPDGQQIRQLWHQLQTLEASLRLQLGYNVPVPSEGSARPEGLGELGALRQLREWAVDTQLDRNVFEADDLSNDVLREALEAVNTAQAEMLHLRDELIAHPELRTTRDVTVRRNGRDGTPDYMESGWQVASVRGDGKLILQSEAQKLRKSATVDELLSWQNQAE